MDAAFEQLVQRVVSVLPDGVADNGVTFKASLEQRLRREYDKPRVRELEFVLQEPFTDARARAVIFFPTSDDMRFYARLVDAPPAGAPADHPQAGLQVTALALLYLVHVKSWELMEGFILANGLVTLAMQFDLENIYLRSQAIDTFLQITGHPDFNWFDAPSTSRGRDLHRAMLALANSPFLQLLLDNNPSPFPGGSFYCLQMLAFWLSWVRALYTGGRPLSLKASVLSKLQHWHVADGDGTASDDQDGEAALAKRLYDDFSRFPVAKDDGGSALVQVSDVQMDDSGSSGGGASRDECVDDLELEAVVLAALLRRSEFGGSVKDVGDGVVFDAAREASLVGAASGDALELELESRAHDAAAAVATGRPVAPPAATATATSVTSASSAPARALQSAAARDSGAAAGSSLDDVLGLDDDDAVVRQRFEALRLQQRQAAVSLGTSAARGKSGSGARVASSTGGGGVVGSSGGAKPVRSAAAAAVSLEREWTRCGRQPKAFATVLEGMRPGDIAAAIGTSLTEELLVSVCAASEFVADHTRAAQTLRSLCELPRFGTIASFLSDDSKRVITSALAVLSRNDVPAADVDDLRGRLLTE